jgi:hypothetical protein
MLSAHFDKRRSPLRRVAGKPAASPVAAKIAEMPAMAKSSKPKEIVVVGSKIKEVITEMVPPGLTIDVDDDLVGTLSWDVDLELSSSAPPPGYAMWFFDDFEPFSTLALPTTTLVEEPLGIVIAMNDNTPEVGDEVLVSFLAGTVKFDLFLGDSSGTAIDAAGLTTPLGLRLEDFDTATFALTGVGDSAPFATGDVLSLESSVIPEPATVVLVVSMLGTFALGWLARVGKELIS